MIAFFFSSRSMRGGREGFFPIFLVGAGVQQPFAETIAGVDQHGCHCDQHDVAARNDIQSGVEQQAIKAGAIRQELQSIGGHTRNVGKMLIGKEAKEIPADTASIGKVEKLLLRIVKRLEKMEQSAEKTRGKLEQFVTGKQKSSVKMELNQLKKQRTETGKILALPDKSMER